MQNTELVHVNTLLFKQVTNSLTIKSQTRTTYPYLNKGKGSHHSRFYKTIKNISKYLQWIVLLFSALKVISIFISFSICLYSTLRTTNGAPHQWKTYIYEMVLKLLHCFIFANCKPLLSDTFQVFHNNI